MLQKRSLGFIAQEVEKIFPEVVWDDKFGFKTLQYDVLVAVGIAAVKDNQLRINNLKDNLTNLKEKLNA